MEHEQSQQMNELRHTAQTSIYLLRAVVGLYWENGWSAPFLCPHFFVVSAIRPEGTFWFN